MQHLNFMVSLVNGKAVNTKFACTMLGGCCIYNHFKLNAACAVEIVVLV
jgi:hypothetical protein